MHVIARLDERGERDGLSDNAPAVPGSVGELTCNIHFFKTPASRMRAFADPDTGQLNDASVHFVSDGMQLDNIQLNDMSTPEEFARRIGECAKGKLMEESDSSLQQSERGEGRGGQNLVDRTYFPPPPLPPPTKISNKSNIKSIGVVLNR